MSIFINKNSILFFKVTLTKVSNANIYGQTILYLIQNNTKQKIIRFQNTKLILS